MSRYSKWSVLAFALVFMIAALLFPAVQASRGGGQDGKQNGSQRTRQAAAEEAGDRARESVRSGEEGEDVDLPIDGRGLLQMALPAGGGGCTLTCPANITQPN